jgi:hypothetical protein
MQPAVVEATIEAMSEHRTPEEVIRHYRDEIDEGQLPHARARPAGAAADP